MQKLTLMVMKIIFIISKIWIKEHDDGDGGAVTFLIMICGGRSYIWRGNNTLKENCACFERYRNYRFFLNNIIILKQEISWETHWWNQNCLLIKQYFSRTFANSKPLGLTQYWTINVIFEFLRKFALGCLCLLSKCWFFFK